MVSDMHGEMTHRCSGHLVMVPGVGCAPACSLRKIEVINGVSLDWTCRQTKNGTEYPPNARYILKDDICSLTCPTGKGAFPKETKCKANGEFEDTDILGCVNVCPAIAAVKGSVLIEDEKVVSVDDKITFQPKCVDKDGIDHDGYLVDGNDKFYKESDICSFLTPSVGTNGVRYIASPSNLICYNSTWSDPGTLLPKVLAGEARVCSNIKTENVEAVSCEGADLEITTTAGS